MAIRGLDRQWTLNSVCLYNSVENKKYLSKRPSQISDGLFSSAPLCRHTVVQPCSQILDFYSILLKLQLCSLDLTLISMSKGRFIPLIIFGLDFVSLIFIKNFKTFLEVKIEINQIIFFRGPWIILSVNCYVIGFLTEKTALTWTTNPKTTL